MSNVKAFGAVGDGKADDTEAIEHTIAQHDGRVYFPRGDYVITRPLRIDYSKLGRFGIEGDLGAAKIIMNGPGPAFDLIGTHGGTGDPLSVKPAVWTGQRLPTIMNLEITSGR